MSRSGYGDCDGDHWQLIKWRGAVASAIKGARGQAFLRELLMAMDAMPEKTLTVGELQTDGEFCALGVVGAARGVDLSKVDTEDWPQLSSTFGIAEAMAREIMFENDEAVDDFEWIDVEICGPMRQHWPDYDRHSRSVRNPLSNVPAQRWSHMRAWVVANIKEKTA